MIAEHLIDILRCPQDRTRVRLADAATVSRINRAIESGTVFSRAGQRLTKPIDGGLIREADDVLYPIIDQIPVMLPDEAIELASLLP